MERKTFAVDNDLFKQVYDSPASLPGKHKWVTPTEDVRKIEHLLHMPANTIGAPLWVSGDEKKCPKCEREPNWLDIVSSALHETHKASMIAQVILGEQKYVNTEVPKAIAGVKCYSCGAAIDGIRSFKCHNWAYAVGDLQRIVEGMQRKSQ